MNAETSPLRINPVLAAVSHRPERLFLITQCAVSALLAVQWLKLLTLSFRLAAL